MAINIHKILSDTLLELCREKKLQSITVQDILKRSGVSRQACQISGQNCLKDYIYNFAINYDLE